MNSRHAGITAIVLPSCGGKTMAAERYAVLDIDVGAQTGPIGDLIRKLNVLASQQLISWDATNEVQWAFINAVIDSLEVGPICIMLHSIRAARAIAAKDIYVWMPSDQLHRSNIAQRGAHMTDIAVLNAQSIRNEALQFKIDVWEFTTYRELELRLQQVISDTGHGDRLDIIQLIRKAVYEVETAWCRKVEDNEHN